MGIIISSFTGCGKTFLTNTYGDKAKIFDASSVNLDSIVNEVMGVIDNYDIVFIPASENVRELFNEQNIDYDVFYPSKERRGEFIENQVRKRAKPNVIRSLDKNFEKWIQEIDDDEASNCYKHKLSNTGEFISNSSIIMQYIDSIKNQPQGQTQVQEETPINNKENMANVTDRKTMMERSADEIREKQLNGNGNESAE